jgi:hypothetical protein
MMSLSAEIKIFSAFPEIKRIEVFKNSDTPWSYEVRETFNKRICTPEEFLFIKYVLQDLSWKENFVYKIYDGYGNLEG